MNFLQNYNVIKTEQPIEMKGKNKTGCRVN